MKKQTQRLTNPCKNSDTNKRYYTFDYYLKRRFGSKCAKISLDAGFSCPNIDGTVSHGGCIYCLGGSSGAARASLIEEQYSMGVEAIQSKWKTDKFIPYLQAHTNTYAPIHVLREVYERATALPGAVMLAIATRADCLSDEVIQLLYESSQKIPLLVELGLQSTYDTTAELINRGHDFNTFCNGYEKLRRAGGDIAICIHLINGLPGESHEMMVENARLVGEMKPDMVKLHLLHVLKGTKLFDIWKSGDYIPMELCDYVSAVCDQIEVLPEDTVVARVTGDGVADSLAAPMWSRKKTVVANEIDKLLFERNSYQGIKLIDSVKSQ